VEYRQIQLLYFFRFMWSVKMQVRRELEIEAFFDANGRASAGVLPTSEF
jgi:hypothetical protein